RATCEKGAIRSSKFWVRSSENLEVRTSNPRSSSQSCSARLFIMIMPSIDRSDVLFLYRQMLLIRRFEEKAAEMYARAKIAGFLHLYIGEEAIAVGAIAALRPDDYAISAYRD